MNSALRPMSTAEVLDRTFYLYRSNFVLFMGISLVAHLLPLAMRLAILGAYGVHGIQGFALAAHPGRLLAIFLTGIVMYVVVYALVSGATVHAASLVNLGRKTSVHRSYTEIQHIFFSIFRIVTSVSIRAIGPFIAFYVLLVAAFLAVVGVLPSRGMNAMLDLAIPILLAAFFVALVWMIYLLSKYALAVPACALEKLSATNAMKRSRFLTKKSLGRNALVMILTGAIAYALAYLFQLPVYIAHDTWIPPRIPGGLFLNFAQLLWTYFADFAAAPLEHRHQ